MVVSEHITRWWLGLFLVMNVFYLHAQQTSQDSVLDEPEEIYRTSDHDKEKPTQKDKRKEKDQKKKTFEGERVGCECMNGEKMFHKGSGACTGKGGVRFWIYKRTNGETYLVATQRHLNELNGASFGKNLPQNSTTYSLGIYETVSLVAVCTLLMYMIKILLKKKKET